MFKKVNEGKLPEAQDKYSAGYDVFANKDIELKPGETKTVPLGFALDLSPEGLNNFKDYFFIVYLRESTANKGAMLVNGAGIININSTEEIKIKLFNSLEDPCSYENRKVKIKSGEGIAQIILYKNYGRLLLGDQYRKSKLNNDIDNKKD